MSAVMPAALFKFNFCCLRICFILNPKLPRAPLTMCMGARGFDRGPPADRLDRTVRVKPPGVYGDGNDSAALHTIRTSVR